MHSEANEIRATETASAVADGVSPWIREADGSDELLAYLSPLRRWWPVIAMGIVAAMIAAGLVSKFAMTKWYRAVAVLRPVSQPSVEGRLAGILGGFGGAAAGLGGMAASAPDAQEFITILNSFAFNVALAKQHHVADQLLLKAGATLSPPYSSRSPRWNVYRTLQGRFSCQYSLSTGNLTLTYEDTDPSNGERMLGFYIQDLRDQLRRQELRDAAAAIDSLQGEIRLTSDTLLQQHLYELMAKQIEHEKLAQVAADFAFTVADPPIAPDKPSRPRVASNCLLAGLIAALGLTTAVVVSSAVAGTRRRPSA